MPVKMEYNVTTVEGIRQFQSDHQANIYKELINLDIFLHDNPDKISYKLIVKHRSLMKLNTQTIDIVNGLLENIKEPVATCLTK